jgi:hypothetical protein
MNTPWTLDNGTIRDSDGEFVAIIAGNGKYMDAAKFPKAEMVVRCVNNYPALERVLLGEMEVCETRHGQNCKTCNMQCDMRDALKNSTEVT